MRAASELVACGSIEMGAHRPEDAARIAELLPSGTPVYVNHLPRHSLADTLKGLLAVRAAGLEPVPHVAARRVGSRSELAAFLTRATREAGVRKLLVIGGDMPTAAGPYADAAAILEDEVIVASGIREVGLAGYPEGHARIDSGLLEQALTDKIAMLKALGVGSHVLTQFSFAPNRIVEFCGKLARQHPGMPVYVGLPGPTSPTRLLRFAQICGVSASLRALGAQGMGAVRLFTNTDPTDQLMAIARHGRSGSTANVVGVHVFSFGGITETAEWMNRQIAGR
jgi:methylenetetrahydrofolate reductase (NADPH)